MSLAGAGSQDVPPVSLVFTGTLNQADEIAPAVDTAAIEAYLTMRRMQEDVERLETLDVSGRTPEPRRGATGAHLGRPGQTAEPPADTAPMPVPEPLEQSRPPPRQSRSIGRSRNPALAKASPSAMELPRSLGGEAGEPAAPQPAEARAKPPAKSGAGHRPRHPPLPWMPPAPRRPSARRARPPASPAPPAEAAVPQAAEQARPVEVVRRAPRPHEPSRPNPEAPDDWKKGFGVFGGG